MNINILPQNDCIVNLFLQKNLRKNSYFFHFFIYLRKKPQKVEKSEEKSSKAKHLSFYFTVFRILLSLQHRFKLFSRVIIYNVETVCRRMQAEKRPPSL